jgi:hypothetical protein
MLMKSKRKGGRPLRVEGARSTRRIVIRVTPEEHSILKSLAQEEKQTIAEFCRGKIADNLT